ncbi:MAG: SRPBCC family protein [Bacteriovoracaceae bacterium]
MSTTKITITTTASASPKKVWEYWTLPKHIVNWNFASNDWHCPRSENDLRVGGKMNSRMEAKDGSFGFDFEAVYDEVIDLKKITYSMADGRQASTLFEAVGDKTKITTTFDAENTHPLEMQKNGWLAILNNFKNYVEGN